MLAKGKKFQNFKVKVQVQVVPELRCQCGSFTIHKLESYMTLCKNRSVKADLHLVKEGSISNFV